MAFSSAAMMLLFPLLLGMGIALVHGPIKNTTTANTTASITGSSKNTTTANTTASITGTSKNTTTENTTASITESGVIVPAVLVPLFLIAVTVALIVVFVCRRKALRKERHAAQILKSDDLENDTIATGFSNNYEIIDIMEKEVKPVNGLVRHGSTEPKDRGHECNGSSVERLSSNGSLRREGDVFKGRAEVDVVVQKGAFDGDCAMIASVVKEDIVCDEKLVQGETGVEIVGKGGGEIGVGLEAGKETCMKENAGDDIGGDVQGTDQDQVIGEEVHVTGVVPVLKNPPVNGKSGVKDSVLEGEKGNEVVSGKALNDVVGKVCRFEGNYETIGEELFGDGVEIEGNLGVENEHAKLPLSDLGESGEPDEEIEDDYATIGGNIGADTEDIRSEIEDQDLEIGNETAGEGGGSMEDDYCEIGGDVVRGINGRQDKSEAKGERKPKVGISLKHFKRPKGGSYHVTSGNRLVEEPNYAVVDLSKKKRSMSEKAPAGYVGVAKLNVDEVPLSDDTDDVYDRLVRKRAWSRSNVGQGQGQNYDEVILNGPRSDVNGSEKTIWTVNDLYSPTSPSCQRKGSVADDNGAKKGVSDGAGSYSDVNESGTAQAELDASLDGKQHKSDYESFKVDDTKAVNLKAMYHNYFEIELDSKTVDAHQKSEPRVPIFRPEIPPMKQDGGDYTDPGYETYGNDVPEGDVDPDYASVNDSDREEEEEDHYATVDGRTSQMERSSSASSCDEV